MRRFLRSKHGGQTFCIVRAAVIAVLLAALLPIGIARATGGGDQNCHEVGTETGGTYTVTLFGQADRRACKVKLSTNSQDFFDASIAAEGGTIERLGNSDARVAPGSGSALVTVRLHGHEYIRVSFPPPAPPATTTTTLVPPQTSGRECEVRFPGDGTVEADCGWEGNEAVYNSAEKGEVSWAATLADGSWPDGWTARSSGSELWVSVRDDNTVQRAHEAVVYAAGVKHTFRFHDDDVATLTVYNPSGRRWDWRLSRPVAAYTDLSIWTSGGRDEILLRSYGPGARVSESVRFGTPALRPLWEDECWDGDEIAWDLIGGPTAGSLHTAEWLTRPRSSGLPMVRIDGPAELDLC